LFNHLLTPEKVGKLDDVIDVVAVFHIVGLIDHSDIIEDIVFSDYELKKNDSHRPNIRLIGLLGMMKNRLQGHICLCSNFIAAYNFQTVRKSFVYFQVFIKLSRVSFLFLHFCHLFLKLTLIFRVDLCQPEINNHASFCIRIV